jgi:two-component system cell cycle sensor histidine kinase/response regulator CckA
VYVSPAWATIWARPIAEGYDPAIRHESVQPEDRKAVDSSHDLAARGTPSQATYRLTRPDGAVRWVQSRFFPVNDKRGNVLRIIVASTDITELYLARDQQTRSQRMEALGRLAGGVAHDFNNALAVMMTNSDFLGDLVEEGEPKLLVSEIREAGNRAAELTKQLLAFSRKQPVILSTFDLNEVIRSLSGMLHRLIRENITFELDLEQFPCPVTADRGQVEQVLVNLVVNARDAMPEGGRLAIRTGVSELDETLAVFRGQVKPGQYVTVDVSDTGTGMTDEVKARIFEPFYTTKAPGEGTGLGLATSYGIVAQARGHLTVYSEVDIGTTFRVYLPLASGRIPEPTAEIEVQPRGGDETILLVEDDAAVRRVTLRLLTSLGYRVLEAGDGESALELLRRHEEVALLFTDVVMHGMGGGELAVRAERLRPGLPVLFTSGYVEDRMLERLLDEQGPRVLRKPFTRSRLARKIREAIERPEGMGGGPGNEVGG